MLVQVVLAKHDVRLTLVSLSLHGARLTYASVTHGKMFASVAPPECTRA